MQFPQEDFKVYMTILSKVRKTLNRVGTKVLNYSLSQSRQNSKSDKMRTSPSELFEFACSP